MGATTLSNIGYVLVLGGGYVGCEMATAWQALSSSVTVLQRNQRLLPGLEPDGKLVWTYKEAMVPPAMPKSVLVVGSGAIGIEFASFYRTMGCEVTVIEPPTPDPGRDRGSLLAEEQVQLPRGDVVGLRNAAGAQVRVAEAVPVRVSQRHVHERDRRRAEGDRTRHVGVVAVPARPEIELHHVALLEEAVARRVVRLGDRDPGPRPVGAHAPRSVGADRTGADG